MKRNAATPAPNRRYVCILGVYGKGNLGDEALVLAISDALTETVDVSAVVFGSDPEEIERRLSIPAVTRAPWPDFMTKLNLIRGAEAIVLGGGTLLCDHGGFVKNVRAIASAFFWPLLGRIVRTPTIVYAQGLGPAKEWPVRWSVRHLLSRVDALTLRDGQSQRLMHSIRGNRSDGPRVTCDPVVGADRFQPDTIAAGMPEELRQRIATLEPYCVVSLRTPTDRPYNPEGYYKRWAYALRRFHGTQPLHFLLFPALLSPSRPDDRIGLRIVQETLVESGVPPEEVTVAHYEDLLEGIALLQHARLAVGDRLHSLLFALMAGTPAIGVDIEDKIPGCLEMVDRGRFCDVFEPEQVGSERFLEGLRNAWGTEDGDRAHLRNRVRAWAASDRHNRQLLAAVIDGAAE